MERFWASPARAYAQFVCNPACRRDIGDWVTAVICPAFLSPLFIPDFFQTGDEVCTTHERNENEDDKGDRHGTRGGVGELTGESHDGEVGDLGSFGSDRMV